MHTITFQLVEDITNRIMIDEADVIIGYRLYLILSILSVQMNEDKIHFPIEGIFKIHETFHSCVSRQIYLSEKINTKM